MSLATLIRVHLYVLVAPAPRSQLRETSGVQPSAVGPSNAACPSPAGASGPPFGIPLSLPHAPKLNAVIAKMAPFIMGASIGAGFAHRPSRSRSHRLSAARRFATPGTRSVAPALRSWLAA